MAGDGNTAADAGAPASAPPPAAAPEPAAPAPPVTPAAPSPLGLPAGPATSRSASPAVRRRALEAGVDLRQVRGSGPAGRIGHDDLDRFLAGGGEPSAGPGLRRNATVHEVKVVGLRRRIAERMAHAKRTIAHITYVEEVDVEALEELRAALNREKVEGGRASPSCRSWSAPSSRRWPSSRRSTPATTTTRRG